jgi:hypothetical protein
MKAISPEIKPQVIMMRASQIRGLYEISGKENSRTHAEHLGGEPQVFVHRKRRVSDVHAIDVSDYGNYEQRQHDVPISFSLGTCRHDGVIHVSIS